MGKKEIEVFYTHLAVDWKVASPTQNQAFNAFLFLYEKVLEFLDIIFTAPLRKLHRIITITY